jgi:mono/diheme cytochrome c family protein
MSRSLAFAPIFLLGLATALGSMSFVRAATPSQAVSRGKTLYTVKGCYTCHGRAAQGSIMSGPPLNPLRLPAAAFAAFVRGHGGAMPPYSAAILSDADLADLAAYLQSLPPPPDATHIPLLAPYVNAPAGN